MAIEHKSIDYIGEHERHGRVIDQGPFWFLGNFHFFTIAIGFVGPSMGLGVGYTGVAVVLIGTLFTFIGFNVADSVLVARGLDGILRWNETAVTLVAAAIAMG